VAGLAARYAAAAAALVVFLFPLYWLVVTALKTPEDMLAYPPVWWPETVHFGNVASLLGGPDGRAVVNSIVVAAGSTILAVAIGAAGAYAAVRAGLAGRIFAAWAFASRLVPPVIAAVPFFLVLSDIGWLDSTVALVLLYAAFNAPFVLWMVLSYLRDVPIALQEAALVAGHTHDEMLLQVAWPMLRGGILATAAFTFLLAWNELAFALVLTGDNAATLPAQLARLDHGPELWPRVAALSVIGLLPALIAAALMHRRLARTLSFGFVRD